MGHMFKIDFLTLKIKMQKINAILKVEHDLTQCAHIFQKIGCNHLQNHLGQNNLVKTHTPYSKGH